MSTGAGCEACTPPDSSHHALPDPERTVLAVHVDCDGGIPGIAVLVVAGGDGEHAVAALRKRDGQAAHHITQTAGLAAGWQGNKAT
jgi:hypothetical protein